MLTRPQTGHLKPRTILNLIHSTSPPTDPSCYTTAIKFPQWRQDMSEEFQALQIQGTWTLVPPHPSQNIIGSKWLFRTKFNDDGSIARYKARLVAQGYKQEYGFNFTETFSPVAKIQTIRVFLTLHFIIIGK